MSPDLKLFLQTLRRAMLAEVAYIDKQENPPAALKGYFEVARRSNLQVVSYIETVLKMQPRKSKRQFVRSGSRMPVQ